jgi:quercetin dioxygenase-like cupin family protein
MNRKTFLRNSSIGATILLIPGLSGLTRAADRNNNSSTPKIVREDRGKVLNVIGDIQTHKLSGTDTGNQIVEWVDNVEPGVGIPPHVHTREDEIFRVIWGEIELMIDGEVTVLKAGDTAFAPKNVSHAWKVVGTEKARMITSAFPSGIEDMFEELAQLPPGPPDFEKVTEICGRYGVEFV